MSAEPNLNRSLERSLARWQAAGLIDQTQADGIRAFEHSEARPRFFYAIAGLGGLAIAIGVVSIIAANWDAIPGRLKLALDLIAVTGLGLGVLVAHRRHATVPREVMTLVLYGLVLASIALIGQVYQLGGSAHTALAVWSLLTAPLMLSGRSAGLAAVWLCGLQLTYAVWLFWSIDPPWNLEEIALTAIYWAPLIMLAIGLSSSFRRVRPAFARMFVAFGWVELLFLASLGTAGFYGEIEPDEQRVLWLTLAIAGVLTAWIWHRIPASAAQQAQRWLLVACAVLAYVPLLVPAGLDVVAALTFIGLWMLVAYVAHRSGRSRLLNQATALIGLRLLVAYFEVFGSLLGTGIGLVVGGLVTLGLMWLWARSRRRFALAATAEPAEAAVEDPP